MSNYWSTDLDTLTLSHTTEERTCMCVCMYVCMYVECCVHVFLVDVNICNKYKQCESG